MPVIAMVGQIVGSATVQVGWLYHLFNSAVIGGLFGWLLAPRVAGYRSGLAWGATYGFVWWVLGGLVLMPVLLGMPAFAPLTMPGMQIVAMGSLVGHLIYGLILGGGFGGLTAARALKRQPVRVTLVDLDAEMTQLFTTNPLLRQLNQDSLHSPKVRVVNADAFIWLNDNPEFFDFAVADFPDPTNFSLAKLYTTAFYRLLAKRLSARGMAVVQSTSPMFARQSYWCIVETLKQAGFRTYPYHVYVPSFGEWGFVLAAQGPYEPPGRLPDGLRFLSARNLGPLFEFPLDMQPVEAEPNRLNNQVLVRYYEREWSALGR